MDVHVRVDVFVHVCVVGKSHSHQIQVFSRKGAKLFRRKRSHFLMLVDLLVFLGVILHDLQPLGLNQTAFLYVELLLCLNDIWNLIHYQSVQLYWS